MLLFLNRVENNLSFINKSSFIILFTKSAVKWEKVSSPLFDIQNGGLSMREYLRLNIMIWKIIM